MITNTGNDKQWKSLRCIFGQELEMTEWGGDEKNRAVKDDFHISSLSNRVMTPSSRIRKTRKGRYMEQKSCLTLEISREMIIR